ncbi:hypothetical protein [Glutamicibacter protophormiae]|uniref:hypothetical protein n=1 Tax=Glutamicibacter protophormiae TaxID=37930 RepID=UPI003A939473
MGKFKPASGRLVAPYPAGNDVARLRSIRIFVIYLAVFCDVGSGPAGNGPVMRAMLQYTCGAGP